MKKLLLALAFLLFSATLAEAQYVVYPRVYYQPQVVWIPQGTYLGVGGYYNPYNRYVNLRVNYGYYTIPYYHNYTFINRYPYNRLPIRRYKRNW